ncbi:hypothetical protein B0H11DRAFT_1934449 [Mycena galericulata]|nr:hypothetical protein B0H11DRAFT_1934449 [Mycena galericulata]
MTYLCTWNCSYSPQVVFGTNSSSHLQRKPRRPQKSIRARLKRSGQRCNNLRGVLESVPSSSSSPPLPTDVVLGLRTTYTVVSVPQQRAAQPPLLPAPFSPLACLLGGMRVFLWLKISTPTQRLYAGTPGLSDDADANAETVPAAAVPPLIAAAPPVEEFEPGVGVARELGLAWRGYNGDSGDNGRTARRGEEEGVLLTVVLLNLGHNIVDEHQALLRLPHPGRGRNCAVGGCAHSRNRRRQHLVAIALVVIRARSKWRRVRRGLGGAVRVLVPEPAPTSAARGLDRARTRREGQHAVGLRPAAAAGEAQLWRAPRFLSVRRSTRGLQCNDQLRSLHSAGAGSEKGATRPPRCGSTCRAIPGGTSGASDPGRYEERERRDGERAALLLLSSSISVTFMVVGSDLGAYGRAVGMRSRRREHGWGVQVHEALCFWGRRKGSVAPEHADLGAVEERADEEVAGNGVLLLVWVQIGGGEGGRDARSEVCPEEPIHAAREGGARLEGVTSLSKTKGTEMRSW